MRNQQDIDDTKGGRLEVLERSHHLLAIERNELKRDVAALRSQNSILWEALQRMSDGNVMASHGTWTHMETVHEYQRIARAALAGAKGE